MEEGADHPDEQASASGKSLVWRAPEAKEP